MKRILLSLMLLAPILANAAEPLSKTLVSGNAVVSPEGIQKIVKALVVKNFSKNLNAKDSLSGLDLQIPGTNHRLQIPKKALLQEILDTLGIKNRVLIKIYPIHTALNFEPDSLKIKVEKIATNQFKMRVHWEITEFTAVSNSLKIQVPKGLFDQAFSISSNPVKIGIKRGTGPITADLILTASLFNDGSKISLESFETNLSDHTQRLSADIGILRVNGSPLELQITSNQQSIITDEPTIRSQFQEFIPELVMNIQTQLARVIQSKFTELATKLREQDPIKYSFESSKVIAKYSLAKSPYANLLKNITSDFIFSYVQELPKQNLFTAQVSSKVCMDQVCLKNVFGTSKISSEDTDSLAGDDAGIILYESWIQNIINSTTFQKRVKELYQKSIKAPGVTLGKDGIKIHFNPEKNSVVAVLNLAIDIKDTGSSKLNSWAAVRSTVMNQLGDAWENIAGSGQYAYLPVEIEANLKGIELNSTGKQVLVINTDIPLNQEGSLANNYHYASNVDKMNKSIRTKVLASIKAILTKSLPKRIEISVDKPINIEGIQFSIKKVLITKNKGLLMGGSIK